LINIFRRWILVPQEIHTLWTHMRRPELSETYAVGLFQQSSSKFLQSSSSNPRREWYDMQEIWMDTEYIHAWMIRSTVTLLHSGMSGWRLIRCTGLYRTKVGLVNSQITLKVNLYAGVTTFLCDILKPPTPGTSGEANLPSPQSWYRRRRTTQDLLSAPSLCLVLPVRALTFLCHFQVTFQIVAHAHWWESANLSFTSGSVLGSK